MATMIETRRRELHAYIAEISERADGDDLPEIRNWKWSNRK
jgi:phosphoketolase